MDKAGTLGRLFMRWLVRWFYPWIQVTGEKNVPQTGPLLVCANHANSLMDPVLIGIGVRRPVRFLAKAPLFKVPVLGALMRAFGMLPAYRGKDDPTQVHKNLESLDAAAQVLAEGHAMGIFPEGKSHDAAHVEPVKSGASRIAIQAVEAGAKGLVILPVGINYEHKERFRSSVWIQIGEPLDVERWIQANGGESRAAMRALTPEIERRLQTVVVHLTEAQWAPFLRYLEVLFPGRPGAGPMAPIRQRKLVADAMNYFLAWDRPRAESIAGRIAAYRDAVQAAGLHVDSPVLVRLGWRRALILVWQLFWALALFLPAIVGTLFHVVPFTVVRFVAARVRPPGRTAVSLYLMLVGIPIYLGWYVACGFWIYDYFTTWFATTCLALLPVLGLLALTYWRGARHVARLWWRQLRFVFGRERLRQLRAQRLELQELLAQLAGEYQSHVPPPPAEPKPNRLRAWAFRGLGGGVAAAMLISAWFVGHWFWASALIDPDSGVDLAAIPQASLQSRLEGDEQSLRVVLQGLQDLERKATALQTDFASGKRSFQNEADNAAVRQLLLNYINYRTVLIRLIWRYQRYAQLEDDSTRLRSFLVGFTSASALYDASLKFAHQFGAAPEAVARLNEGEPAWGIPPGLYDSVQRNLANRTNIRLLRSARQYYDGARDRFAALGLGNGTAYEPFHAAIEQCQTTAQRLAAPHWRQETLVAAKDLRKLVHAIRYETQSAISTWIGDFKIREPRGGSALIQQAQLEQFRQKLQPGDILLERRNWFLSNAFLPGYWPHAALYVGTVEDLKHMGLDQDPRVQAFWNEYSQPDAERHTRVIIEALSEGVLFNSLEHSIGGADSAAILRPKLFPAEIKEAIAQAFGNAAKPYDFEFDFDSRDKLVCTEVVFRAYGANLGPIRFPVKQILGRQTMPAIELVRKVKEESSADTAELHFVAFIDGDERTNTAIFREDAQAFFQTLDRPALTLLQGFEERPVKQVGVTGWTLLMLIGTFTLGNLIYYGRRGDWLDDEIGSG